MHIKLSKFINGFACGATACLFLLSSLQSTYQAEPLPQEASRGKELFQRNHCSTCHSISSSGGCLAPPLDDVGKRRGKEFILSRITDTQAARKKFAKYKIQELMPHPRVGAPAANELTEYLSTLQSDLKELKIGKHPINTNLPVDSAHVSDSESRQHGKALLYSKGCLECHSVLGGGGEFAPALDGISKRQDRKYVLSRINNAELLQLGIGGEYQEKGTSMPPSNLSEKEIESITDFIMSLPPRK